jgi:menaquinone-dependent protoporphyrinogen oxidase
MTKTLIIYSTTDGQTKIICQRIALQLKTDESTDIVSLDQAVKSDLGDYDRVIIGASIRYGKHRPELYRFIAEHQAQLEKVNSAFFSVNVVARKPLKNTPETNPYMIKFLSLTDWQPKHLEVFAGKIDYPRYGFVDKQMIRLIMYITKGPTDISGTFEFTDWKRVDAFAQTIIKDDKNNV